MTNCQSCGYSPTIFDGFNCYAPDFTHSGGGFKSSYFQNLANMESANFWFRVRNEIIIWALKKYAPNFNNFLEIGCGTGYVLSGIKKQFPSAKLSGSEIFLEGLKFAAERMPTTELFQMDARKIPFNEEFDAVGIFDVLEHIEEDEAVLSQIYKSLKSAGLIIITIPQHDWLWSITDEYAFHKRRYSADEIEKKVQAAGFKIVRSTSFVTTLLPLVYISRLLRKKKEKFDPTAELSINPKINFFLQKILEIELSGIKLGFNYPVGSSRIVLAEKAHN